MQKQQENPRNPPCDELTRRVKPGLDELAWTRRVQPPETQKTNFPVIQCINTIETSLGSDTTDGFWS